MAKAKKQSSVKKQDDVVRIKASTAKKSKPQRTTADTPTAAPAPKQTSPEESQPRRRNPLRALGDYFKGAWYELRQVRWPTRKATWGFTLAVLLFTGFFTVLIVLLDALFKYVFQLILG